MDEKKDSKGFTVIKQIVTQIWKIILLLFFFACIILQAPLKLLIPLTVFLLAVIILPARFGKWVGAAVGIFILVLVLWIFLPEKGGDWKPFTFDDELAKLESKRQIPDEENAAILYNRLMADYNKSDLDPNFITGQIDDITASEYWPAKDYPQIAEWINGHQDTIDKLLQASKFEKCKFDATPKSLFLLDIDRTGAFRQWTRLLSRASNNDIAEDRNTEGLEKIRCIFQMGKHLCQQALFVDLLCGFSREQAAINRLKNLVITGQPDKNQLDSIEEFIEEIEYDWQSDLPRVLDYEKLLMKNMLSFCCYEINPEGKIRYNYDPQNAMINLLPDESNNIPPITYFNRKFAKAWNIIYWFFVPANPRELSKTIDEAYQKNYKMAKPDYNWNKRSKRPPLASFKLNYKYYIERLMFITEPTYYDTHDLYLRGDSMKNGSLLLIALRRYKDKNGFWPENLDQIKDLTKEEFLTDPVNNQSFVYERTDDSFILYSKGKNGIDDGGVGHSGYTAKQDDVYIWPLEGPKEPVIETAGEPNDTRQ